MARVYVSIGSNIERERSIRGGVAELRGRFGEVTLSPVYESEAVGFDGDNFLNLVAAFDTGHDIPTVAGILREIEERHGRRRDGPRFSSRTLDIDLLLYGDRVFREAGIDVPRGEITENAFVLQPLADLAPDGIHPVLGVTFGDLWARYHREGQLLWRVAFDFGDTGAPAR